jgi:hypothetical protein
MLKTIEIICDSCDSEFVLKFNEKLVPEYTELFCPFCKALIENLEEENDETDEIPLDEFDWE